MEAAQMAKNIGVGDNPGFAYLSAKWQGFFVSKDLLKPLPRLKLRFVTIARHACF
jgi:hypothetical protein